MQDAPAETVRQTDLMDPARANAWQVALGMPAQIRNADPLPPFFHQLYFWDARPPAALGRDGHPRVGAGLIPDLGLPRRMWAGGRLAWHAPLLAGIEAEKVTTIESVAHKQGRSGALGFVTLRHEIVQKATACVTEWQDLVYREEAAPDTPRPAPPAAREDEQEAEARRFDSTLLFRYSALTFNGHRIHYDLDYATQVEGYGGLVVHGPMLAQLLMLMAARQGALVGFSFRATAPLMHTEEAHLCRNGDALWVRGPDGRQCMSATATWS